MTLEDRLRQVKVMHETAIPIGIYKVILTWSPKFKKVTPELLNVPNFTYIRIHPGNTHLDTSGCILVGESINAENNFLLRSRAAFDRLMPVLTEAAKDGITLYVVQ